MDEFIIAYVRLIQDISVFGLFANIVSNIFVASLSTLSYEQQKILTLEIS